MALYTYGGTPAAVLTTSTGDVVPDYALTVRTAGTGEAITALYELDGTPIAQLRSNPADDDQPGAIRPFQCEAPEIEYEYNGLTGPVRWYEAGREVAIGALELAQATQEALAEKLDASGSVTLAGALHVTGSVVVDGDLLVDGQAPGGGATGVYDVRQLGAAGDGVADDAPAIQAALNAARDAGGGMVLIPPGTYKLATLPLRIYRKTHLKALPGAVLQRGVAGTMLLNGDAGQSLGAYSGHGDLVIEGGVWDCKGATFTASAMCMSIGHAENVLIRDLLIKDVSGYHGIEINSTRHAVLRNLRGLGYYDPGGRDFSEFIQPDLAKGSAYFGGFGPYDDTPCVDVLIEGCVTGPSGTAGTTAWPRGIGSHSASPSKTHKGIRVRDCRFEDCSQFAIGAYTWEAAVFSGIQMLNCGGGIRVRTLDSTSTSHRTPAGGGSPTITDSQPLAGIVIDDVTMSGGGSYGAAVEIVGESTGYVQDVTVGRVAARSVGQQGVRAEFVEDYAVTEVVAHTTGSTAISTLGTRRGRIANCLVNGSGGAGITVDSRSTPAATSTFVTVAGCHVQGSAANGVHLWSGEYVTIMDCELHDLTGMGIQISTNTNRPRILGNRIRSTTSTGLSVTSTVTGVQRWGNYVNSLTDASTTPNTSSADLTVA